MAETTLDGYVLNGMKPHWRGGVKHHEEFTLGVADISGYLVGAGNVWIENKVLDKWPTRPGTMVKLKRYTDEQRLFLVSRRGFLLLRVGREYLLFDSMHAWQAVGLVNEETLRRYALKIWKGSIEWREFCGCIIAARPNYMGGDPIEEVRK